MNTKRLEGKVALITGASKGLGRATALAFAREGASLAICARGEEALDSAAAEIPGVLAVRADVGSAHDREVLVGLMLDRFGRVDVLVNNASTLGPTPLPLLADLDIDAFAEAVNVNLVAPFALTRALIGQMLLRKDGLVINISSDAAVNGYPGWGAYSAGKAGLDGLTRVWAAELEGTGVRVLSIDPSDMDTEMHRAADPEADPADLARPEDIAEVLVRIAAAPPDGVRLEASQLRQPA